MNKNNPPSINPADTGTLEGVIRFILKKHQQNMDSMMPAKVISYDRKSNRAVIQPLVQVQGTDGQTLNRAPVQSVPVFRFGGSGAILSFPLKPGDTGLIFAGDRDVSLVQQSAYSPQPPNTDRMHSFENGAFLPDSMSDWNIDAGDLDKIVIGNTDGSVKITIGGTTMDIVSSETITITCPEITIDGNLKVTGTINAEGGVTGSSGISLEEHRHEGVTPGDGTSGKPVG